LEIKGGSVEGQSLDSAGVDALSKSPGREELLGRVLMLIRSPGGTVAGALLGGGGKVAGQIKSIAEKEGEAAEPAAG
jgi:large subunit ribosomal protein L10